MLNKKNKDSVVALSASGRNVSNLPALPTRQPARRKDFESGVYFYRIKSGEFVSTKKMVLLK